MTAVSIQHTIQQFHLPIRVYFSKMMDHHRCGHRGPIIGKRALSNTIL